MYNLILILFVSNCVFLILHEIESAYENEWNILHLPGSISFFLFLHIPILILMFIGIIEIQKNTLIGKTLTLLFGVSGLLPFIVHKVAFNKKDVFNRLFSNIIIYCNLLTGVILIGLFITQ